VLIDASRILELVDQLKLKKTESYRTLLLINRKHQDVVLVGQLELLYVYLYRICNMLQHFLSGKMGSNKMSITLLLFAIRVNELPNFYASVRQRTIFNALLRIQCYFNN
jgi:hypothetical protein